MERSDSEFVQSLALTFFLKIAHSNPQLYTEFIRKDFTSLIGPIIRSSRCIKGINLLNSILETACDKPVLTRRSDGFHVVATTNANILHPNLLMSVIKRYSDWHVPNSNDSSILATLLETIESLCREKHPRHTENIHCLGKVGMIPALLNFCKIHLVGVPEPVFLSRQAAEHIVSLISIFAGSPPTPVFLDEIIKLLLLLHRPSESFITHDRSKFYFLLSSMTMVKHKRISIPITTKKLGISIRRERKNTVPMRKTPTKAQNRSLSLDHPVSSTSSPVDKTLPGQFVNPTASQVDKTSPDHSINPTASQVDESLPSTSYNRGERATNVNEAKTDSQATSSTYPASDGLDAIVSYSPADRRVQKFFSPGTPPNSRLNLQLKRRSLSKKTKKGKKSSSNMSSRATTDSETEKEVNVKGLDCFRKCRRPEALNHSNCFFFQHRKAVGKTVICNW